jgi:hypothetical protein
VFVFLRLPSYSTGAADESIFAAGRSARNGEKMAEAIAESPEPSRSCGGNGPELEVPILDDPAVGTFACRLPGKCRQGKEEISIKSGGQRWPVSPAKSANLEERRHGHRICRRHFHVCGCRYEIDLKKPLHTGHFKSSATTCA